MRMLLRACLVILVVGAYGAGLNQALHAPTSPTIDDDGESDIILPQNNHGGWVNPEDLSPMPQCIAQQDGSFWLSTMTKCTEERCTSHFGIICTHHQWLTELSCLSVSFSSDVVARYLPYCDRSVLAKAQLYSWIRNITGRTWLVEVGDANGLQYLSPASLDQGYASVDVIAKAPKCLISSTSVSREPFQHVIASCGFTSTSQDIGNPARPWEYRKSSQSMVALDFETVGYDLVGNHIRDGDYFDKGCFCGTFTINLEKEPCLESGQLEFTKERLWINATCGSTSLPNDWTDTLMTTQFSFIPIEDWRWPMCVADMPKQVTELTVQCATDACEIDSSGYCNVRRAVDRTCVCRNINYDSCTGLCHIFETRIDYVDWLHGLCGDVQDWHGLPDDWHQLTEPTSFDLIPWGWTISPFVGPTIFNSSSLAYASATEFCTANGWKLASFALVNISTFLAVFFGLRIRIYPNKHSFPKRSHQWSWLLKGTFIVALQLLANLLNALIVQNSPGYTHIPVIQLMLLWCSVPRLTWLAVIFLVDAQSFEPRNLSTAASLSFAEVVLQSLSSYHMMMTVNYGREHNLYFGGRNIGKSTTIMYAGALMWLITVGMALIQLTRAARRTRRLTESGGPDRSRRQGEKYWQTTLELESFRMMAALNGWCTRLKEDLTPQLQSPSSEETPFVIGQNRDCTPNSAVYGTFFDQGHRRWISQKVKVSSEFHAIIVLSMFLFWIAQWMFWGGFILLTSDEFCLPRLGAITAVWVNFSFVSTIFVQQ